MTTVTSTASTEIHTTDEVSAVVMRKCAGGGMLAEILLLSLESCFKKSYTQVPFATTMAPPLKALDMTTCDRATFPTQDST